MLNNFYKIVQICNYFVIILLLKLRFGNSGGHIVYVFVCHIVSSHSSTGDRETVVQAGSMTERRGRDQNSIHRGRMVDWVSVSEQWVSGMKSVFGGEFKFLWNKMKGKFSIYLRMNEISSVEPLFTDSHLIEVLRFVSDF